MLQHIQFLYTPEKVKLPEKNSTNELIQMRVTIINISQYYRKNPIKTKQGFQNFSFSAFDFFTEKNYVVHKFEPE